MKENRSFKTYIKGLRYRFPGDCSLFIVLYNDDGKRFYGAWLDESSLDSYFDYEIAKTENIDPVARKIWVKGYKDPLGIESMKRKAKHLI